MHIFMTINLFKLALLNSRVHVVMQTNCKHLVTTIPDTLKKSPVTALFIVSGTIGIQVTV